MRAARFLTPSKIDLVRMSISKTLVTKPLLLLLM